MSMVFKFRMLSDENDNFLREYEVPYDMTLLELHRFICRDLKYDPDNMVSFFLSDSRWNKVQEYTLVDMGAEGEEGPIPMSDVILGQIIHKDKDRLIYLFDMMADRAFFLELVAASKTAPGTKYPHVTASEAAAPDQFDPDASQQDSSIFDEAMGEFSDFEGDDSYDDEY